MRVRFVSSCLLSLAIFAACGRPPDPALAPVHSSSAPASAAASAAPPSQPASVSATPARSAVASPAPLPPLPTQLLIPAIHVDAPVEQVGTTEDGAMDVPKEWEDVGWFEKGYRPGQSGSAVVAGHLDSTTDK